jgi:hypothetical protein
MEELDIIELFIDEQNNEDGVYAISLVERRWCLRYLIS